MTLEEFRYDKQLTYQQLADMLGEKQPKVWQWCNGKAIPRRESMMNIRKKTAKKVDYSDWY